MQRTLRMFNRDEPAKCPQCGAPTTTREAGWSGGSFAALCPDCRRKSQSESFLTVQFCQGGWCNEDGAREALPAVVAALRQEGVADDVSVVPVSCMGVCDMGPVCRIVQQDRLQSRITASRAPGFAARLARVIRGGIRRGRKRRRRR